MRTGGANPSRRASTTVVTLVLLAGAFIAAQTPARWTPQVPRVWEEAALEDWATPVAGLNLRPTHMPEAEYYALPVENVRSYPVYMPGREPAGYWEQIQGAGPQPLVDLATLRTKSDWMEAGKRVFNDWVMLRTFDPTLIAMARDAEALKARNAGPLPDGTINNLRWLPTKDGVALGFQNCAACHVLYLPDHTAVAGAPAFAMPNTFRNALGGLIRSSARVLAGEAPFVMGGETFGSWLYQAYGAPWTGDPAGEQLKAMTEADYQRYVGANLRGGAVARWNGSILYPAKVPDLIGVEDRRYIDHTATHLHRGIGDLMRYAALVSVAEDVEFGPHRMTVPGTQRFTTRLPDELLYALGLYIYSLQPPANPNPFDARAAAGEKIFQREGCVGCHTPPLYTNNKVTLARGFTLPADRPASIDVLPISVGTDPGLALRTRKGTGYYKVPSLKGVWYRGRYLHDGSVATLEEMFDPARLEPTHAPGGWIPPGEKTRAIAGHEFGLTLRREERDQLVAFLKTL